MSHMVKWLFEQLSQQQGHMLRSVLSQRVAVATYNTDQTIAGEGICRSRTRGGLTLICCLKMNGSPMMQGVVNGGQLVRPVVSLSDD